MTTEEKRYDFKSVEEQEEYRNKATMESPIFRKVMFSKTETFLEIRNLEEANKVDLDEYRFLKLDEYRGYCFVRRSMPKKKELPVLSSGVLASEAEEYPFIALEGIVKTEKGRKAIQLAASKIDREAHQ
jgi:hypothetical protein